MADEPVAPRRLNPSVPRDLETVCLKCLQKEPQKRYASAAELADDLRRFERGEPIAARRIGVVGSLRKWARRRPAAAAMLAAVALVAATGAVGAGLLYEQLADARARQDRTDQEVHAILGLARVGLDDGWKAADLEKLAEASAEVVHAEDVARGGASPPVRQEAESFREEAARRLERAEANRTLTDALVDLDGPPNPKQYARDESGQWRSMAGRDTDKLYAAVFRQWGLDIDGAAEAEVVARLAAEPEPVVQKLIAALDTWARWRRQNRPGADWRRLFRVVDQLDGSDRRRRLRALALGEPSPGAEVVAGMVGARSPWQALWELQLGVYWRRLQELRREIDPRTEPVLTVELMANMFVTAKDFASAEEVLSRASTARPREVVLLHRMGSLLADQEPPRLEEAIGYYRAARSLRPRFGVSLSDALVGAGRPSEAEAVMQELLCQRPGHPDYLVHLGFALMAQRRYGEAEATYRQVIELDPDYAEAQSNLGSALVEQGKYAAAEVPFRRALALNPDLPWTYSNLGLALLKQGKSREAEEAFLRAMSLRLEVARSHHDLGRTLSFQGKHIALRPEYAEDYVNLGIAVSGQGRPKEAEQAFRDAIRLKPDLARAHNSLGVALNAQGRHKEAERACRDAIRLKPDFAEAHFNLGVALRGQGMFEEALKSFRRCATLFPSGSANCRLAQQLIADTEPLIELDARLTEVLADKGEPASPPEKIRLAGLAQQPYRALHCAAVSLYSEAFAARPALAARHRYAAACAAALAGCGQGKDAADLDDAERARRRRQALEWLRLDLAGWRKALDEGKGKARAQVRARMQHWRSDGDFAGVRGSDALARIPAGERKEWERFWAEVDALIRRASEPD
jgi:serine/threonine-protein kinase